MSETLWITLPTNEENQLKGIINSIKSEGLRNLSLDSLLNAFQAKKAYEQEGSAVIAFMYEEANKWQSLLRNYSAIIEQGKPIIHLNTDTNEILSRMNSVKRKFREHGKSELAEKQFAPNELLCLIIMCYTNPTLIGPKLCQALKDNNSGNIKKEMIENSAYSKQQRRVLPFSSNLRLLSTALYFNDTSITLPTNVIDRVTRETIQKGLIVKKVDQRGGFEEVINGPERAAREGRSIKPEDSYQILQSLDSNEQGTIAEKSNESSQFAIPPFPQKINQLGNASELTTEPLPLHSTNNAASSINNENLAIAGLLGFHIVRNLPIVSPVMNNIGKDLKRAGQYVGNLFSRNIESEQQEEQATLLSPTARS